MKYILNVIFIILIFMHFPPPSKELGSIVFLLVLIYFKLCGIRYEIIDNKDG